MALTIDDTVGGPSANSYATVAEADAYLEAHVDAAAWTGAGAERKKAALIQSTRMIDRYCQFFGARAAASQALEWPRVRAYYPDNTPVPVDEIPQQIVDAEIELALALLQGGNAEGGGSTGVGSVSIAGAVSLSYNNADRPSMFPAPVKALLRGFGRINTPDRGTVKVVRT